MIFIAVGTTLSGCISPGSQINFHHYSQETVSTDEVEKITEEITQLSNEWNQVPITKDIDHLKRIWADDFSFTVHDTGDVSDRKGGFAYFEDDTDTYTSARLTAFKVRVYGKNFAVANGDDHYVGKDKDGKPFSRKGRFTCTWVRQNGKWQVVAGHGTWLK